ncbi:MAG: hypothetical protein Q8880_07205 [Bacteroidota bacterium]|nr:hypothetical protein [Bacteroidota bacterium]
MQKSTISKISESAILNDNKDSGNSQSSSNQDSFVVSKRVLNNILNFSGALLAFKSQTLGNSSVEIILN